MRVNWRRWNRVLHRDLGFFVVCTTLIYAFSGIALNHLKDWNPSYTVTTKAVTWERPDQTDITKSDVLLFLDDIGEEENYKKYYFPESDKLKVFLKSGNVVVDLTTGRGILEKLKRRPVFYEMNRLHYNPKRLWTWFSDIFCVSLILVAVTGLFIIKGKKGITGRGALLTGAGAVVPLLVWLAYL